jgi:deazaflavin-dependent oxidoreductase (nitroreductase family)
MPDEPGAGEHLSQPARFWRNRGFARVRHNLAHLRSLRALATRTHARIVVLSGGRITRSFLFTGRMPILVLTTTGRRSGQRRSTPLGYLPHRGGYAVLASNAGSDRTPAWWLNLQADPRAEAMLERKVVTVVAEVAAPEENDRFWGTFARMNPGYDEYRRLTDRPIPVVLLRHTG